MATVIITSGTVNNNGGAVAHGGIGNGNPTNYAGLKPAGPGSDAAVQSSTVLTSNVSAAIPLSTVENEGGKVAFTSPTTFTVGDVVSIGGDSLHYTLVGSYLITSTGNSGLYITDGDFPTVCVDDLIIPSGSGAIDAFIYGGALNNITGDFQLKGLCTTPNGKAVAGGPPHTFVSSWQIAPTCLNNCDGTPVTCPELLNDGTGYGVDVAVDTTKVTWQTGGGCNGGISTEYVPQPSGDPY